MGWRTLDWRFLGVLTWAQPLCASVSSPEKWACDCNIAHGLCEPGSRPGPRVQGRIALALAARGRASLKGVTGHCGEQLISCSLTSLHYSACRRCSLISLLNYELGSRSLCSCSRLVIPTTLFPHLLIKPGTPSCNKHFKHFFGGLINCVAFL
jgi:hypothetical protein